MSVDAPEPTPRPKALRLLTWGFAALGVVAAIAMIFLAVTFAGFMAKIPNRAQPQLKTAKNTEAYRVEDMKAVRGTEWLAIEIGTTDGSSAGFSSGTRHAADQRNLVLLDRRSGDSRRILMDNSRHIDRTAFFPASSTDDAEADTGDDDTSVVDAVANTPTDKRPPPPPFAYYLLAVKQAHGDGQDLLIGTLATGQQTFVMKGVDRIERMWMLTPTRLALILSERGTLFYRVVDIPALKVVTSRQIEIG